MTSRQGRRSGKERPEEHALVGSLVAGKYRVLGVLGQGGFGTVFLVENEMVGGKLAMKVLPRTFSEDEKRRAQFLNEVRVAMRMVNKYIVQIRDVGTVDDTGELLYYTMDYVPGKTLAEVLREEGRLPIRRAVPLLLRVLNALITAHSKGIIHRDLKPANIMIQPLAGGKETARVLDFGIATATGSRAPSERGFSGSPYYMPPEQFLGTEMGYYTDVYAVGVILYECLAGERPYGGNTAQEVYDHIKRAPAPPVETVAPEVTRYPGLAEAINRALERNPEKRFQSAREFYDALTAVAAGANEEAGTAGVGSEAAREERAAAPRRPKGRARRRRALRRRAPLMGLLAGCAILALGGALALKLSGLLDRQAATPPSPAPPPVNEHSGPAAGAPAASVPVASAPASGGPAEGQSAGPAPVEERPETPAEETVATESGVTEIAPLAAADRYNAILERARAAEERGDWAGVKELASEALQEDPEGFAAAWLRGKALYHLAGAENDPGQAAAWRVSAASDLARVFVRRGCREPELCRMLAETYLALAEPRWAEACPVLERLAEARPSDTAVLGRLFETYLHLEMWDKLGGRLASLPAGIDHPGIATARERYEAYVATLRKSLGETLARHLRAAREAHAAWDHGAAVQAAEAGLKHIGDHASSLWKPPAGTRRALLEILVEARTLAGDLDAAERDLRALRELAGESEEALAWRLEFLKARIAYRRHEKDPAKLVAAESLLAPLDRQLWPQRRRYADLCALVRTYLGSVYARLHDEVEKGEPLASVTELFRFPDSTLVEVGYQQALSYMHIGDRRYRGLEKLLGAKEKALKEKDDEIEKLRAADQKQRRPGPSRALRSAIRERAVLAAEISSLKEQETKLRRDAFDSANAIWARLLKQTAPEIPARLEPELHYLYGRSKMRKGVLQGHGLSLREACEEFAAAEKTGLSRDRLPELYDLWGETLALRGHWGDAARRYEDGYRVAPAVERGLRAAEAYIKNVEKSRAAALLDEEWTRSRDPRVKTLRESLN